MTYRSLSRFSPDFHPNAAFTAVLDAPRIRFRHVALLLLGSVVAGGFVGILLGILAYGFTQSNFVGAFVFGMSLYGSFLLGYHWVAQERDWTSLRVRFAPVGAKPLVLGALLALALIGLVSAVYQGLLWAGIKVADVPSPLELESLKQIPLALLLIVVAAPIAEELLFRGLLLDWLRQRMNVWLAASILSVVFSLIHNNPFSSGAIGWLAFTHRFLVGLAASALAIKYRSLRPSLVLHATLNAAACLVAAFAAV